MLKKNTKYHVENMRKEFLNVKNKAHMFLKKCISKNACFEYELKIVRRHFYIQKLKKMNKFQLMNYNASLYEKYQGKKLDWNKLNTYSEKMQWEKLFDDNSLKTKCTDKYLVREWVEAKVGQEYLIPLLGVWDSEKDIIFSDLPEKYVLKTNCSSGDVILVNSNSGLTYFKRCAIKKKLKYYLKMKFGFNTCELHYNDISPKIVGEEFIESPDGELQDYKFLCFDGEPQFCWVDSNRRNNHKRNVYDLDWNLQPWNQKDYGNTEEPLEKPQNFNEMVEIAKKLSAGFSHVRVDLYNVDGKIYFGEMTFTNGSGFEKIIPDEYDYMLGDMWHIDTSKR